MSKILAKANAEELTLSDLNAQLKVETRRYVQFTATKAPDEIRMRCYKTIKFLQDRIHEKLFNSERNKELDLAVHYLKNLTMRSVKYDRVLALVDVEFVIDLVQRKEFAAWYKKYQNQQPGGTKIDVDKFMDQQYAS
jgi:hypothetical protein